ncbi:MAG TPA: GNAT family N-acetyltransferase [Candidatus Bathyarchaeia archaeon]|nr:GNAT family N-acetyltransferase [Candidatus Bathyarchaeia archaeon]
MIKIEKLTEKYLSAASKLADTVFKDEPKLPSVGFEASLDQKKFKQLNEAENNEIASLEYFVAVDETDKVVGTTGLYALEKDKKDTYWLGWYCVDPEFRGKGVGSKLLDYTIEMVKERGKKFLRLYTSTSPEEKAAQIIYDSRGFETTKKEKSENSKYEIIYKELAL